MNCRLASYPSIRSHPSWLVLLAAFASLALVQNELKAATLELVGSLVHLLPSCPTISSRLLSAQGLPPATLPFLYK